MGIFFTIMIMVSVFAFGFFVVDLFDSPLDKDSRDRNSRVHRTGKNRRSGHPGGDYR